MRKTQKQKKGKQETGSYTRGHTHTYINKHCMSLSLYIHICTHTEIYHKHRYWEDEEKISRRQVRTSKGKNEEVYTETLHLFVSAAVPDTDVSPVLAEKGRINPVALELSNVSEGNCNFLGQLQERCKG